MPQPTPSNILFKVIEGDSLEWPGFELDEYEYDGDSFEYEKEGLGADTVLSLVWTPNKAGLYFAEGFQVYYTKDYEGEIDASYEVKEVREATEADKKRFER